MVLKKALPFKIPKTTTASLILQTDREPFFYDKLHQHEEFQLTLIIDGSGTVVHGEYVGAFKSGDVFLMGSNVPHVFRCDESYYQGKKKAHAISIFFAKEQLKLLADGFTEFQGIGRFLERAKLGGKAEAELSQKLGSDIREIFRSHEFERMLSFIKLINRLSTEKSWHSLLAQSAKRVKEQDGQRLDDIFSYTLSHYHKQITIERIADVAHMNKSAFCRYFKQHTRKSYIDFLNEYRIQKACGLLADPDKAVAQVAFEVGFANLSNFNRQFKKLKGETPRAFRKKVKFNYN